MVRSRQFFSLFVTILTVFTILSLPVSARTTHAAAYALAGYSGSDTEVFAPDTGGVRRLDMTGDWDFTGDVMYLRRNMKDGWGTALAVLDPDESDGKSTFSLALEEDLAAYDILCVGFGMTFRGEFPPVRAELELTDSAGNRAVYQTDVPPPSALVRESVHWTMLFFDLSSFEERDDVASLELTFRYDADDAPSVLRVTNPYAKNEKNSGFDLVKKYLTNQFDTSAGTFAVKSGSARPDHRGQLRMRADFVLGEVPKTGSDAFLEITLSRVLSGGLTVELGYDNGDLARTGRLSLASASGGRAVYTVPVDTSARLKTFALNFDSIVCDAFFRIESVRLHATKRVDLTAVKGLGKVTSMTYGGNSVAFSGTMERDAVREYGDYDLTFYAIPGWTSDDLSTAVAVGQRKVSTRFDHTVDLSAYPYLSDTYRFFVGLSNGSGDILPLSIPMYPDAPDIPETTLSNIGLYNAASVGVFESNASHVIVDIPVDRLLTVTDAEKNGTAVALTYTVYSTMTNRPAVNGERNRAEKPASTGSTAIGSRTLKTPVNRDLLRELDSEINFYISAGLEVYLRLTSATAIPGLTYEEGGAQAYLLCPEVPETRYFYTALVRFLCGRYGGIGGLIVGDNVNDGRYTGGGMEGDNAAIYARELAEICRITYNAASSVIPDILIVLPFADSLPDDASTEIYGYIDPRSLTVMMSSYLENMGGVPWVMMYCTAGTADIVGTDILQSGADGAGTDIRYSDSTSPARQIERLANELGLSGSADILYFYEPSYEAVRNGLALAGGRSDDLAEYLARCFAELCGSTRARAVFLSLDRLRGHLKHEFYANLKNTETSVTGTATDRRSVTEGKVVLRESAAELLSSATGAFALWDFTDKFHPHNWIAGGGVSSCATVYSELFSPTEDGRYARVLRSVITPEKNAGIQGTAAGIALRNLSRTIDFTGVDYLEFTFALNTPGLIMGTGNEGGSVVFVLGSDDRRMEFEVENAAYGQILTYVCDLSDYEHRGKVDFLGVMVYAENEVYLDLSSVKVYSGTLDSPGLREVFFPPAADEPPVDLYTAVVTAGIVFTLSLMAIVLLFRHDAEERRERQILRQAEEERRRKRERIRRIG